jgi:hypothetical protein
VYSQILTITPDSVTQGQTLNIEVTAENIDFTQGTNVIIIKQDGFEEYIFSTTQNSNTLVLNHTFSSNSPIGNYDMSIWNTASDITLSKNNALYVKPDLTAASIYSISQDSAKQGDEMTIILYGYNTAFDKANNTVYLMNPSITINATGTNSIDSVTLEAQFNFTYAHPAGLYSIYAKNDLDGTLSIANTFILNEEPNIPTIKSISHDTVIQGQTSDIKITAENVDFTQGFNEVSLIKDSTEIYMNSSSALNSNTLDVNFSIDSNSPTGIYTLKIWNTAFDVSLVENQTLIIDSAIYLKSPQITGIVNNITDKEPMIYPNPTSEYLVIRKQYNTLRIFDIQGKKVFESKNKDIIDISDLNSGIYLIRIKTGNKITTQKLIVQ